MLVDTVNRLTPLVPVEQILILTNAALVEPIAAMLPQVPAANLIAEPRPAGTGAALAWATHEIARRGGRDAVVISVHSDAAIADAESFRRTLTVAVDAAQRENALVTVGIVPDRADTGFGYIQPGAAVTAGVSRVARFVEKPDRERAESMVAAGYLWNSGIFVWRAGDFLDELRAHTPEVAPQLAAHADDMHAFFAAVTSGISVDVGVLERSNRILVVGGRFGWDDVGTWAALGRVSPRDVNGNALLGTVHALDAHDNVVHASEGGNAVVVFGVSNLVVVSCDGLTLVTTVERAADLKTLTASLPSSLRDRA